MFSSISDNRSQQSFISFTNKTSQTQILKWLWTQICTFKRASHGKDLPCHGHHFRANPITRKESHIVLPLCRSCHAASYSTTSRWGREPLAEETRRTWDLKTSKQEACHWASEHNSYSITQSVKKDADLKTVYFFLKTCMGDSSNIITTLNNLN